MNRRTGDVALIQTLRDYGIHIYAGVNSDGLGHLGEQLEPLSNLEQVLDGVPRLLTMSEYVAGYVPLGYFLASGRIAGCMTTSGAAIKLASSGISDAKVQNIPAVYLFGLNAAAAYGMGPLQDMSEYGMNIIPQLQAELADGCVVIDSPQTMGDRLEHVQHVLSDSRPAAIAFYPDIQNRLVDFAVPPLPLNTHSSDLSDLQAFVNEFPGLSADRRVIVFVCAEASRYGERMVELTTRLSELLHAATVWSVNGANAVSANNPYGYGYIAFGGNDQATALWRSLNADDIVICLGFDAGEFALMLDKIPAGLVWHFTGLRQAYGTRNGDFRHRVDGDYRVVQGDLDKVLEEIIERLPATSIATKPSKPAPASLNTRNLDRSVASGCVDLVAFYSELHRLWRPRSIGFDDICGSCRDRQYVVQRPHPAIKYYALGDGCNMGAAFGLGVGAKLADPSLHAFVVSGDGCWRLYGGALADCAHLGIRLFVINNRTFGLVDYSLRLVRPDVDHRLYHTQLPGIDFGAAARAHGWAAFRLKADLSNLDEIMDACYGGSTQSILIDVPSDPVQRIGEDPRLASLASKAPT